MAVFVAASDESAGGSERSTFWHGGWVAPEKDWSDYFAPAWQERVLDAHPKIPYLHMTELRDSEWQREHGLTWLQAQDKLDEAINVIDTMGSLYPLTVNTNAGAFLDAHGKKKVMQRADGKGTRFLVDHFSFHAYMFAVLKYISIKHPDAEKVDFVIERKEGVFDKLEHFYESYAEGLTIVGESELIKYMGELIPAGKDRIPVQAADVLCWHASRLAVGNLAGDDYRRTRKMLKRLGNNIELEDKMHRDLALVFAEKMNEQKNRVPEVRRSNEKSTASPSRKAKGRTGRRKGRKAKKAKG